MSDTIFDPLLRRRAAALNALLIELEDQLGQPVSVHLQHACYALSRRAQYADLFSFEVRATPWETLSRDLKQHEDLRAEFGHTHRSYYYWRKIHGDKEPARWEPDPATTVATQAWVKSGEQQRLLAKRTSVAGGHAPEVLTADAESNLALLLTVNLESEKYDLKPEGWLHIVEEVGSHGRAADDSWSCKREAKVGMRFYMLRQGDSSGIVGRGRITRDTFVEVDPSKGSVRKVAISFDWAATVPPPGLDYKSLRGDPNPQDWSPRGSGIELRSPWPEKIDELIAAHVAGRHNQTQSPAVESNDTAEVAKLAALVRVHLSNSPVTPHCLIFEGVPGTGKTHKLSGLRKILAEPAHADCRRYLQGNGSGRFAMTMHPATAYEDFVEGLRPGAAEPIEDRINSIVADAASAGAGREIAHLWENCADVCTVVDGVRTKLSGKWIHTTPLENASGAPFSVQNGFFVEICIEAAHFPLCKFIVLLDELNRCNIPKVMGELLTTLESSKRAVWTPASGTSQAPASTGYWDVTEAQVVALPYSKRLFFVPDNVIVIGTMNTTDRSVAPMDAALRRRFAFERIEPMGENLLKDELRRKYPGVEFAVAPSIGLWASLNRKLGAHGDDAKLGHSYLFDLARDLSARPSDDSAVVVAYHWNRHIFPQLVDILLTNDLVDKFSLDKSSEVSCASLGLDQGIADLKVSASVQGSGMMRSPRIVLTREKPENAGQVDPPEAVPDLNKNLAAADTAQVAQEGQAQAEPTAI